MQGSRPDLLASAQEIAVPNSSDVVYGQIAWRIMPFLMLCYIVAFIDRSNVGFAKLQFSHDLRLSETVYGIGGGVFYLGYILFEIPSNLYLAKVGVRKTLLRIMILWGVASLLLATMTSATQFYVFRFILGAGEAGLFPGIILYLTYWVPTSRRARFTALFMSSIPIAGMLGGPFSGWIMHGMSGVMGWRGWQWVFVLEGVPACLLGVAAYFFLDDRPADAPWLGAEAKALVSAELERDRAQKQLGGPISLKAVIRHGRIFLVAGLGFALVVSTGGIFLWLPTIIQKSGVEKIWQVGLLSAVPFLAAYVAQYQVAKRSDLTGERRWHTAIPALFGSAGWALLPLVSGHAAPQLLFLIFATAGTLGAMGPYWSFVGTYLAGTAAAGGVALITTIAGIGGFISPILVGWLATTTGSLSAGAFYFASILVLGVFLLLIGTVMKSDPRTTYAVPQPTH